MATWRRSVFPACPGCNEGGGNSIHLCSAFGDRSIFMDLETGTKLCAGCKHTWSLETTAHHCNNCGAIFQGGELWVGMRREIGHYRNLAWVKRLGLSKGTTKETITGHDRCSFCGGWDRPDRSDLQPQVGKVFSSEHAGICDRCVDTYRRKFFNFGKERNETCLFCYKTGREVRRLFTEGSASICGECLDEFAAAPPPPPKAVGRPYKLPDLGRPTPRR